MKRFLGYVQEKCPEDILLIVYAKASKMADKLHKLNNMMYHMICGYEDLPN